MEFIYGRQPILEALKAGHRKLQKISVQDGLSGPGVHEVLQRAKTKGVAIEWVTKGRLDKLVQGHHQGMVAEGSAVKFLDLNDFLSSLPSPYSGEGGRGPGEGSLTPALSREGRGGPNIILVALDEIQDPHNVGAILRSAGFFGVAGALVLKWRSAPVGETAARVSSGAIDHVPLMRITNLATAILDLQAAGFEVIGADMEGEPLESHVVKPRSVLVFGSEGSGLRRLVRERCDKLLRISGGGQVGSLNVSASASIFLYTFCRPI